MLTRKYAHRLSDFKRTTMVASLSNAEKSTASPVPDFRTVFEQMPGRHLLLLPNDPVFTVVAVSNAYLQALNQSREELEGRSVFEVFSEGPDFAQASTSHNMRASFLRVLTTQQSDRMAVQRDDLPRPKREGDGLEERYWSPVHSPVLGANGKVNYLIHSLDDVTQHREAEQAQLRSEERLRLATEAAELGIWVWNVAEDRVTWENDRMYEIVGLSQTAEPINAARFKADFVHPEDATAFERAIVDPLEIGARFYFLGRFRRSDGKLRWIEFTGRVHHGNNDEPVRVVGTAADVTDRKLAELALVERARLAALGADVGAALTQVAALPEALLRCTQALVKHLDAAFARIWTLAPAGDILELQASAGLYTHLDGPHARVPVGSFKIGLVAQERRPYLTNDVANDPRVSDPDWAKREGMVSFAGYPLVVEDRLVGVLGLFARHPLAQDTLTALASVATSIAIGIERKRAEQKLLQNAQELARWNRELEEFAYVASHDLQEPLRMVSIYSHKILQALGDQNANLSQYGSFVRQGVTRMQALIQDLLTFSQAVHTEDLSIDTADLSVSLRKALSVLEHSIEESAATVASQTLPVVRGDTSQMAQVFQNLLSNALKYRKPDVSPEIDISVEPDGDQWIISVRDNGIGFESQYAERIFGLFKRLHKEEYPGTGLGLAICQRIVERYGGRIWAEGRPGYGATFRFSLLRVEGSTYAADPTGRG